METVYSYETEITDAGGGFAIVHIPDEIADALGATHFIQVRCTFDGVSYQGTLGSKSGNHAIIIKKEIRKQIGKNSGDLVSVTIQKESARRELEIPRELQQLLDLEENRQANSFFETLSKSYKYPYCHWINSAKKEETRMSRAHKAILKLSNMEKFR